MFFYKLYTAFLFGKAALYNPVASLFPADHGNTVISLVGKQLHSTGRDFFIQNCNDLTAK